MGTASGFISIFQLPVLLSGFSAKVNRLRIWDYRRLDDSTNSSGKNDHSKNDYENGDSNDNDENDDNDGGNNDYKDDDDDDTDNYNLFIMNIFDACKVRQKCESEVR